jgi:hypothetical protein
VYHQQPTGRTWSWPTVNEPEDLAAARTHLAKAESTLMTREGLADLDDGLALLEGLIEDRGSAGSISTVARNLGATYTTRIYGWIKRQIDTRRNLTEPELEHLFAVMRAFDATVFDLPPEAVRLKIEVARRLVDLYYEGRSDAEKQAIHDELARLASNAIRK